MSTQLERRLNKLETIDKGTALVVREEGENDEAFTTRMHAQGLLLPGQRMQIIVVTTGVPSRIDG